MPETIKNSYLFNNCVPCVLGWWWWLWLEGWLNSGGGIDKWNMIKMHTINILLIDLGGVELSCEIQLVLASSSMNIFHYIDDYSNASTKTNNNTEETKFSVYFANWKQEERFLMMMMMMMLMIMILGINLLIFLDNWYIYASNKLNAFDLPQMHEP